MGLMFTLYLGPHLHIKCPKRLHHTLKLHRQRMKRHYIALWRWILRRHKKNKRCSGASCPHVCPAPCITVLPRPHVQPALYFGQCGGRGHVTSPAAATRPLTAACWPLASTNYKHYAVFTAHCTNCVLSITI